MNDKKAGAKHKKILITAAVLAAACIALVIARLPESETVTYTEAKAEAVTMEQTLTAAGEVRASSSEDIEFSASKTFAGMCVEEGDAVRKGQHLISYSDGTYTDAPDNGVVTSIEAPETGTVADDDDQAVTLACTDQMVLEISVPEDEISKVSKGDEAKVTVNSDMSKTFNGTITSVKAMSSDQLSALKNSDDEDSDEDSDEETTSASESAGSTSAPAASGDSMGNNGRNASSSSSGSTAYYTVDLTLTNDGSLKPGMSGNCTITVSSRRSVLAVPIEAVLFDENEEAYVEVTDSGNVTETPVTTGESDADYVEITRGLSDGDTVRIEVRR